MAGLEEKSVSLKLAEFVNKVSYRDIPPNIIDYTKERILDNIGAGIAGSYGWDYNEKLVKGFQNEGIGTNTVFGKRELLPCSLAAMVNTSFTHSLELDDGHRNAGVHAGAVIIPTALAVGEKVHASGQDVLAAIIAGYEIIYRLARNLNPVQLKKGFHPSATCGALGAAATAAKLLGLDVEGIANALGLAGLQAAGLMEATHSAQSTKCVMVGHGSMVGVVTAYLAKEGLVGPSTIFEGENGLFKTMSEQVDNEKVIAGLGEKYEITDTYTKLYPNCRHIHAAIEGLISLKEEYGFSAEDVDKVKVGTYQVAVKLTGSIYEPEDAGSARFSLPYSVAVVLKEGSLGVCHLEPEYIRKPDNKKYAHLVQVEINNDVDRAFPQKRGAHVEVILKDGRHLEKTTYTLKGSPELPVGWDILHRKFMDSVLGIMTNEHAEQLSRIIENLEKIDDINNLTKKLVPS